MGVGSRKGEKWFWWQSGLTCALASHCLPRSLGCERLWGFAGTAGDGASQSANRFSLLPVTSSALVQALLCISASLLLTPHALSALSTEWKCPQGSPWLLQDPSQEPLFSVEILPWSLRGWGSREEGTREKWHPPAPGLHRQQLWFHAASWGLGAPEAIRPSALCTRSQQTIARGPGLARRLLLCSLQAENGFHIFKWKKKNQKKDIQWCIKMLSGTYSEKLPEIQISLSIHEFFWDSPRTLAHISSVVAFAPPWRGWLLWDGGPRDPQSLPSGLSQKTLANSGLYSGELEACNNFFPRCHMDFLDRQGLRWLGGMG